MKKTIVIPSLAAILLALPLAASASVYEFNASLDGTQEAPTPTAAIATGLATLKYDDMGTLADLSDDRFGLTLAAFDLTGTVSGAHIHAPGAIGVPAGVVFDLIAAPGAVKLDTGATFLYGIQHADGPDMVGGDSFLTVLKSGMAYLNLHTAAYSGGEIRGQLVQVATAPEPSEYALMLAGLALVGMAVRRRGKTR